MVNKWTVYRHISPSGKVYIAECCRGKTNKYKNYYWRYKDGK